MANSVYSQEFSTYHRKIVKELDRLKEDKNSYKHENKKDRIKDLIFGIDETLCNNKVFDKFYDVAWEHCDDINVAKQKLDELLVELIRELEQAIIIKNGNIVIQFLTEISKSN
jgi:sulfur carrier protein ThiS